MKHEKIVKIKHEKNNFQINNVLKYIDRKGNKKKRYKVTFHDYSPLILYISNLHNKESSNNQSQENHRYDY